LARRAPYRRLALLAVALVAAAALVIVPLAVRAARSAPATCLGPQDAGTVSIGQGIDAGVIALTAQPGTSSATPVSVRIDNGPVSVMSRGALWVSGGGRPAIPLDRRAAGCWAAQVPRTMLAGIAVRTSAVPRAPVIGRFRLPSELSSGAALLAKARQATLRLAALHEITLASKSVASPPQAVVTAYAGSTVTSRSGAGTQRFSWPGWRTGFEWMVPGIQASVVLGTVEVGGVPAVRVAGAVARSPLWIILDIDPATGAVLADSMNGPNHVMTNRYTPAGG
jgi:hypothetical protein